MIGIDAVDVERLRAVILRDPRTAHRLFTDSERAYCGTKADPLIHLAGTLAVKEAVVKAARLGPLFAWGRRIQVHRNASGVPTVAISGRPDHRFDISISHDGPVAVAVAIASDQPDPRAKRSHTGTRPRPDVHADDVHAGDVRAGADKRRHAVPQPSRGNGKARSRGRSSDPLIPNEQLLGYLGMARADGSSSGSLTADGLASGSLTAEGSSSGSLISAVDLVGGSDFP